MKYTIECRTLKFEQYRLTENSTWRRLEDPAIAPGDLIICEPEKVKSFGGEGVIVVDGKAYYANTKEAINILNFEGGDVFIYPRLHRSKKPDRFTREDVRKAIAEGDDSQTNKLVLDIYARFRLIDPCNYDPHIDPYVAVAHEMTMPNNCGVGKKAAENKQWVNDNYISSLACWYRHLKTGELNIFSDDVPNEKEDELWQKIEQLEFG